MNILDDVGIIKLINETNFPDYYYKPINRNPDDYVYPLPSFGLYPKN
jgi:hypothetical protein